MRKSEAKSGLRRPAERDHKNARYGQNSRVMRKKKGGLR